ncbi:MAG: glycosyltransferase family 4 protein, partial [Candidatus Paceibacterota bacterium]
MKILFIINGNEKGGLLTWLKDLSEGLIIKGYKIYYAASTKGESYNVLSAFGEVIIMPEVIGPYYPKKVAGISIYSPVQLIRNRRKNKSNSKKISQIVDEYLIDRIIPVRFYLIPELKVNRHHVKIFCALHSVPGIDSTPFKIKSRLLAFNLDKADTVVAVGNIVKERLLKYTKKDIIVIPNGCSDFYVYKNKREEVKRNYSIPNNSICIGTLGRFSKQKGFKEVIQVFEKLALTHSNLHCILGGAPSTDKNNIYYQEVKEYAVSSKYSTRIHFLGNIDNKQFYPIIDLYLMITIESIESFGLVLIEAMSSGIPVIASGKGGPKEIISHEENGYLVYDGRLEMFNYYCNKLLNNAENFHKISFEGRKLYTKHYSLDTWVNNWINAL